MRLSQAITEKLKNVCGLDVVQVEPPATSGGDEIFADEQSGRTVFVVSQGNKNYAFAIDGCGEQSRITAALAREFALGVINKISATDEPVRAFLDGTGDIPQSVHIGKSDYYVFAVFCASHNKGMREYLKTMAGSRDFVADMTDDITAFCKSIDNESDYQSAGEFAAVLRENLAEEIKEKIKIGVGGIARGAFELPLYYGYAKSALINGAEFDPQNDIYSYKEYALIKTLSGLTTTEKERYVKTVLDRNYREVLEDKELMLAADAFFKHSLNISEASRSMYVHRNTLIYRLDKIEKQTGLNIRNFADAMTFRTAYLLFKML